MVLEETELMKISSVSNKRNDDPTMIQNNLRSLQEAQIDLQ